MTELPERPVERREIVDGNAYVIFDVHVSISEDHSLEITAGYDVYGPFGTYTAASDFKETHKLNGNILRTKMILTRVYMEKYNPDLGE
jgi:hypothetical protein